MLYGTKSQAKGTFALAEMILSVAVLAVLGGFTVYMFIYAKNLNSKSYDLYKGMAHAITIVETVKNVPHPEELTPEDFEPGAIISGNGQTVMLSLCFDEHWAPISSTCFETPPCYLIEADITQSNFGSEKTHGKVQVWDIDVQVVRLLPYTLEKCGDTQILSIQTTKCYTPFAK